MAASKSMVAFLMMVNLAMFALVSTNAATEPAVKCPNLNVCLDIADSLLHVQFGDQSKSKCCDLLAGLVDLDAAACVCTSLKTTGLGDIVGTALGLVGGLLGGLTGPILDKELLVILNACGRNAPENYICPA